MTRTTLGVLFVVATVTSIQLEYAHPVASGYIYRSDNNGPASLIQLGPQHQPHTLQPVIAPLGPLKLPGYQLAPVPLPYIAAKPIVVEDAEEDDDASDYIEAGHDQGHGEVFEKGSGSDFDEEHSAAHGEKGSKGYSSKGHHAKGNAGHYGKTHKEGFYHGSKGEKGVHHDEKDAHGKHYVAGNSYKGGDHGHKKHSSKGEDVTGYHKVFHKDEFKKDHDFYDVADNSGHFNKHGYAKAQHDSEKGGKKKAGHHEGGFDKGEFGKVGFHAKGHNEDAEAGHSAEEGHESYYKNSGEFEKGGDKKQNKEYAYADDDDEDDDDYE